MDCILGWGEDCFWGCSQILDLGLDFHMDCNPVWIQSLCSSIFQVMVLGHSQISQSVAVLHLDRGQMTDDFEGLSQATYPAATVWLVDSPSEQRKDMSSRQRMYQW